MNIHARIVTALTTVKAVLFLTRDRKFIAQTMSSMVLLLTVTSSLLWGAASNASAGSLSVGVPGIDQSYQLYRSGDTFFLKTDPVWVPIGTDIIVIIPIYKEGQILRLQKIGEAWSVDSVSIDVFNADSPSPLSTGQIQYLYINSDEHLDIKVTLGGSAGVVNLINNGTSSGFVVSNNQRRVIYIHTDLLGSTVAETNEAGEEL